MTRLEAARKRQRAKAVTYTKFGPVAAVPRGVAMQAAAFGLITYNGRACKKPNHGTLKYTSSSTCVACVAASSKARNATIRNLLKGIG